MTLVRGSCLARRWPLVLLFLLIPGTGSAQDSHYWNQQYGTRSTLLGGAVVGSVSDLSATFYNPGALSILENPDFVLSANVYEFTSITLEDGTGSDRDLGSSSLRAAPDLVAGLFNVDLLGGKRLAYSFLTRQRFNLSLNDRVVSTDPDGTGEVFASQDVSDIWFGLTWAREVKDGFGVGITGYGSVRNQRTRFQATGQRIHEDGLGSFVFIEDYDYDSWALLAKLGAAWRKENWSLGLSVTTPRLQVYGSGNYYVDLAASQVEAAEDFLAADLQDGVSATYKSPWSIGGGGSYEVGRSVLHLSLEWFSAIDGYQVLDLDPVRSQTSDEVFTVLYGQQQTSVWNGGLGFEYEFGRILSGYGSFATDHSSNGTAPGENSAQVSRWDIRQITAGAAVRVATVELTLGLAYSWGSDDSLRLVDFDAVDDPDGVLGEQPTSKVAYRRVRFLFGFTAAI